MIAAQIAQSIHSFRVCENSHNKSHFGEGTSFNQNTPASEAQISFAPDISQYLYHYNMMVAILRGTCLAIRQIV